MATSDATLRAGEIKKALLEQIDHYEEDLRMEEVGEVLEVRDGVASSSKRATPFVARAVCSRCRQDRRFSDEWSARSGSRWTGRARSKLRER
jgi:hypothetical protein